MLRINFVTYKECLYKECHGTLNTLPVYCIGGEQHNGPHAWARGVPDVHERAGAGLRGRQPLRLREGPQGEMQHALVR